MSENVVKSKETNVKEKITFLIITGEFPIGSTFVIGPFSAG